MIGFALAVAASTLPPADPVALVAQALAQGRRAETARDYEALLKAARTLELSGAAPGEGEDLAARWRRVALAGGARDDAAPYRGRALGPAYRLVNLAPGKDAATSQIFLAGRKALISVVPTEGATLWLEVAEEGGSAVCTQAVTASGGRCAWLPLFTRRYQMRVANRGARQASFFLISN